MIITKSYFLIALLPLSALGLAQSKPATDAQTAILKELSEQVCQCIDSIEIVGRKRKAIDNDISRCIDDKAVSYQLMAKLMSVDTGASKDSKEKKNVKIEVVTGKESQEYKKYYYEMERYLFANCAPMKIAIASNEVKNEKSVSENPEARGYYDKALDETKKDNFKGAIQLYEKALEIDPDFAFAYDNMGICYRRLNNFDKAIECYQKSLEIDPNGRMPLQNIAVAYQYKEEYQKAVDAYQKLAELDANDPEIFYGIGQVYALKLKDYEKGLDNMCKAYNLYVAHKSPYRSDAEKVINMIRAEMKQVGKEQLFDQILKNNNISQY